MHTVITSQQHAEVKLVASLSRRKERKEQGLFLIEGIRFVEEAYNAEAPFAKVYYTAQLSQNGRGAHLLTKLQQHGVPVQEVTAPIMQKMADTEEPQGILATMRMTTPATAALEKPRPFVIVCDGIQDPGNLGTIIRTADAAGVDAVFTTRGTVDIYNPKVLRATMGSVFHLPIFADVTGENVIAMFAQYGISSIGTSLSATKWHFAVDYHGPIAFWLGNEASGISVHTLSYLAEQVKIPMPGRSESLNVAVAASVLMYECVRQRMAE
jgi:RNA methyltransferase, TrmH family